MSIFSKAAAAIKSFASNVVGGAKIVGGAVNKALSGSSNTANVYTPAPSNYTPASSGGLNYTPASGGGLNYTPAPLNYTPSNFTPANQAVYQAPRTISSSTPAVSSGRSSSGGGSILGASTVNVPTTITANSLSGSSFSSPSLPSYSPPALAGSSITASPGSSSFNLSSLLTPALAAQGYTIKNNQLVPPSTEGESQQEKSSVDKYIEKFKKLMPEPSSKAELYKTAEEQAGIQQKQNLVNSYTSQLNEIVSKQQADLLSTRGQLSKEGGTEAVYGGIANEINREAAIKSLPVAAQLAAAQNDLQTAQTHLDSYFRLVSDDVDAKYKYQTDLIKSVFEFADKEDQRKLDELNTKKSNDFTLKRDAINQANEIAKLALQNGQNTIYSQITALNSDDPQYAQKVALLGGQVVAKPTGTQADQVAVNSIYNQLNAAKGEDGYTDPNLYSRLRASSSLSPTEFDNRFGDLVNPESRNRLGLGGTANKTLNQEQLSVINDAKARIDYGKQRYEDVPGLRAAIIQQELQETGFDLSPYI